MCQIYFFTTAPKLLRFEIKTFTVYTYIIVYQIESMIVSLKTNTDIYLEKLCKALHGFIFQTINLHVSNSVLLVKTIMIVETVI
jgi:hypothetical protein